MTPKKLVLYHSPKEEGYEQFYDLRLETNNKVMTIDIHEDGEICAAYFEKPDCKGYVSYMIPEDMSLYDFIKYCEEKIEN